LDPAYAQAYAGLADAILYRRINAATQKESQEALDKGRAALRKALEIDETLAAPRATLGLLAMNVDSDWPEAERNFKRAIELNPNYATAHQWYGEFLAYMGRFDEAVAELERAQELDPLSLIIATDAAKVYALARRYDEAITQYKRVLEMDPNFAEAHGLLGVAYSLKGRHEEAIAELHEIEDLENHQVYLSWLGYVYGQAGKKDEGRKTLGQLENLSRRTKVSPFWMALIHTGLGDKEQAFAWLGHAFAERADSGALTLKVNPIFDSLRSDPRYSQLLLRAGFAP
jgi:tetratricopeptide (TPR) repeat protein